LGHLLPIPRTLAVFSALRPYFISVRQIRWMKLRGSLVLPHTNTTMRSIGSFEAVRLEVVRLAPPLAPTTHPPAFFEILWGFQFQFQFQFQVC
jgi:hypothetical protein